MNSLFEWFSGMPAMDQVFWGCALVSTVFFLIQFVLTLIGMDSSDVDVDFDAPDTLDLGGGLSLFSIRNLVNFFMGFGWAGISFRTLVPNNALLCLVAVAFGLLFVLMFLLVLKKTRKLETNGAFRIADCVGKTADVYLRIPGGRAGTGKVQISVNGSVHEINAVTDGTDMIPTGGKVRVDEVIGSDLLLVSRVI